MIYLIGGAPRCGKTTIAKKLSKDLGISWISADTLESVASVYLPEKDKVENFPKSVVRKMTEQSNDTMYKHYTAKQITNLYAKQAKTSFPAIKMVAEVAEMEGHDYVIEGHQVHPIIISKIINKLGKKNVRAVIMTRFDVKNIVEGCKKHKAKNDWFIQKTKNEETYNKIAEMIAEYSRFFEVRTRKHGIKIINTDDKFKTQIKTAVDYLKNT